MDFFGAQDQARRSSALLVFGFVLSVAAIVVVMYVLADLARAYWLGVEGQSQGAVVRDPLFLRMFNPETVDGVAPGRFDPVLFGQVAAVVGGFILVATVTKLVALSRGGGAAVAAGLGGREVQRGTTDPKHRVLINVVDEMAIAAGTPSPPVYVVPDTGTINAFAAGYSADDAVIGVTQGALDTLSRDELQGVVAHEFSHILHGDMHLNMRLMCAVFGIAAIAFIGRMMMYSVYSRSRDGRAAGIAIAGVAVMVIGYVGVLLGNLIRAAISRQREFLADASAVQYTRNPDGIGGALVKLAETGGRVSSPRAAEYGHMLFEEGVARGFANPFASHPPIKQRIKRVLPDWEPGAEAPRTEPSAGVAEGQAHSGFAPDAGPSSADDAQVAQVAQVAPAAAEVAAPAAAAAPIVDIALSGEGAAMAIGQITDEARVLAARFLGGLDRSVLRAAEDPHGARAVIYALLIHHDHDEARERQLRHLRDNADAGVFEVLAEVEQHVAAVQREWALSLAELCMPALRMLSKAQFELFDDNLAFVIEANGKVETFEWCLRTLVRERLLHNLGEDRHADVSKRDAIRYALSMLARCGGDGGAEAFARAAVRLGKSYEYVDETPDREGLRAAFFRLRSLRPERKRQLVMAAAECVMRDGSATLEAFEMFRVFASLMGCPVPPTMPAGA